jgi:hypothetical protein
MPVPTEDIRNNIGTWAAPNCGLPAIGNFMHDVLPNEDYDPRFLGQYLQTTYYDTPAFDLRKARRIGDSYITIRTREYPGGAIALSAKTDQEKFRLEVTGTDIDYLVSQLPANLQARLMSIAGSAPIIPVITVCCYRFAVEDDTDRYTLDVDVKTDTEKRLPFGVLEYKSNTAKPIPNALQLIGLRPVKLSKFLWAMATAR